MYNNLIWDFDGTLFDTYPAIAKTYQRILAEHYGKTVDYNIVFSLAKQSLRRCHKALATSTGIDEKELTERFRNLLNNELCFEEPPFPGAEAICKSVIKNGGRNFIVTHRKQDSLLKLLALYDMQSLFTEVVCGDHGFARKPHPAAFEYIIDKYKLSRETTLGIGDRLIDIEAARATGIATCFFDNQGFSLASADYSIASLFELEEILRR